MSLRHRVHIDKAQARHADAHTRTIHDFLESYLALQRCVFHLVDF